MCPGGDITFECRTNNSFLKWNITTYDADGNLNVTRDRVVSSSGQVVNSQPINNLSLSIARISDIGSLPLISTLMVPYVTAAINGATVNCTEVGSSIEEAATMVTTIQVISTESTSS